MKFRHKRTFPRFCLLLLRKLSGLKREDVQNLKADARKGDSCKQGDYNLSKQLKIIKFF